VQLDRAAEVGERLLVAASERIVSASLLESAGQEDCSEVRLVDEAREITG
jgi:hypothetical protein